MWFFRCLWADYSASVCGRGVGSWRPQWGQAEALSHANVEKSLGARKQEQAELSEKLKVTDQARLSAEAGLKTVER